MQPTFRPLGRADLPMVSAWVHRPHVHRWWKDPVTVEEFEAEYGPCIDGTDSTEAYVVQLDGRDVGFIQCYVLDDHPAHLALIGIPGAVGIDYFIGDPDLVGRGVGTRVIGEFVAAVVRPRHPAATAVIADPEVANAASRRVLEKNGFRPDKVFDGKYGGEQLMVLDLAPPRPSDPTAGLVGFR